MLFWTMVMYASKHIFEMHHLIDIISFRFYCCMYCVFVFLFVCVTFLILFGQMFYDAFGKYPFDSEYIDN